MRSSLLLASLLAVVPFISASPTRPELARRSTPTFVPQVLADGHTYTFSSCLIDSETDRLLVHEVTPQQPVTVDRCVAACADGNFDLAGVENSGASCFCGNQFDGDSAGLIDEDQCKLPCPGNITQACGGFNLLLLYADN